MSKLNMYDEALEYFRHQEIVRDANSLVATLEERSDFHAIVLGMAWLDNMLELVVPHVLKHADALRLETYNSKVRLLHAVGALIPNTYDVLLALGKIRNQYAHKVSYELATEDYQRLVSHANKWDYSKALPGLMKYFVESATLRFFELREPGAYVRAVIWILHYTYDVHYMEYVNLHMFGTKEGVTDLKPTEANERPT